MGLCPGSSQRLRVVTDTEDGMFYRLLALWNRYRALTTGLLIVSALGLGAYLLEHLVAR